MASDIVNANIHVHTRMAESYNTEPHFRPENQAKVQKILAALAARCGGGKLLDMGCGTGFIIHLARSYFKEIHGVDVTQAMMDKIDRSGGTITLHNSPAETVPFPDAYFDMVSAYSFIHHVEDSRKVLKEACRVLRKGGLCYVDLEPNKLFWRRMMELPAGDAPGLSAMIKKARDSVTLTDEKVQAEFGIAKDVFNKAEYGKSILGGIDPDEISRESEALGFSSCAVRYEWFVGQGDVMHGQSFDAAETIENHLRALAPLSNHLFKYVQFIFVK